MPHAIFLIPGVGAQGGRVEDLAAPSRRAAPAVSRRPRARSPTPIASDGGDPADAARAEAERLRAIAWGLAG